MMIATLSHPHSHVRSPPQPPPSYSTIMSETSNNEDTGLKSRFSVSTVGSPRPVSTSTNAYNYRDSYAPYPLPVPSSSASAGATPPHVAARRRRQQEKERRTLSLQASLPPFHLRYLPFPCSAHMFLQFLSISIKALHYAYSPSISHLILLPSYNHFQILVHYIFSY